MNSRGVFVCRAIGLFIALAQITTASAVVFTSDTAISLSNTNYEGDALILSNCTGTVDGPQNFASLLVGAGGTLTHSSSSSGVIMDTSYTFEEPHTLVGTNPVTLVNSNVTLVLEVIDDTHSIVYNQYDDWTAAIVNGIGQVQRTTNSTIPDGANVLISYQMQSTQSYAGLTLTLAGDAEVAPGGVINAAGKGYGGNVGTGNGGEAGSPQSGGGAGYGGNGGASSSNAPGGISYGSFTQPANLGSGGGAGYGGVGGGGGGAIRLIVGGTATINGLISANGANATNSRSGGGSGGSIWITAGSFTGSGAISANGGLGEPIHGGGGGGGRIAIEYGTNSFAGGITAYGANGGG